MTKDERQQIPIDNVSLLCELQNPLFFTEISKEKENGSCFVVGKINLLTGKRLCRADHCFLTPVSN